MKAFFLTTKTNDCTNHVEAWNSVSSEPAIHLTFEHRGGGIRADGALLHRMREESPDVLFYIGAHDAPGNPKFATLRAMRDVAPFIHLCSDAADKPWWSMLMHYARGGCFTLQVALDGGSDEVPVPMYRTLTPVDARPFATEVGRDIRYGFSGSVGRGNIRSEMVRALEWFRKLNVRPRDIDVDSYEAHARFMRRCQIILNFSWTGSSRTHHIKGRVLEAGFAGCALLEHEDSPIGKWLPPNCYIPWRDVQHVGELVETLSDERIERSAFHLSQAVRAKYGAARIYGEILEQAGVGHPLSRPAA